MKIIFSRKGFDSATGGVPSPIFPSGRLHSLPIPDAQSSNRYADVRAVVPELAPGHLGDLVQNLTGGKIAAHTGVHLDPDLWSGALPRRAGWRPLFGQAGAAQGHLRRQGVGAGDLFLFYGWFRAVEWVHDRWAYVQNAPDLHLLFGWLQVDTVLQIQPETPPPDWAASHPHCQQGFLQKNPRNNCVYVAAERLAVPGSSRRLPGAGLFSAYHPALQLTANGSPRSVWRLPGWFFAEKAAHRLSYHAAASRWEPDAPHVLLQTVGRGQEFVFDTAHYPRSLEWVDVLFSSGTISEFWNNN